MAGKDLQELKTRADVLRKKLEAIEDEIYYLELEEIAEYSWVYTGEDDFKYLHSASDLTPNVDMWDYNGGTLDCGLEVSSAQIPGFLSRGSLGRCPDCCDSQSMPQGIGSPKNDKECREILGLENKE